MKLRGDGHRGDLNGFLDAGSHLHGELHFEDTFRVDGKITGRVTSKGELVVGDRGEVEGEVEVGSVVVSGQVRGRIQAARRLEIAASGKVHADVETPVLVMEEGGVLQGSCAMQRGEAAAGADVAKLAAAGGPRPAPNVRPVRS